MLAGDQSIGSSAALRIAGAFFLTVNILALNILAIRAASSTGIPTLKATFRLCVGCAQKSF